MSDLVIHLDRSVMLRVRDIPQASCVDILFNIEDKIYNLRNDFIRVTKGQARLAVLFSGGIDSTVLSYFAHKYVLTQQKINLYTERRVGIFLSTSQLTSSMSLLKIRGKSSFKLKAT